MGVQPCHTGVGVPEVTSCDNLYRFNLSLLLSYQLAQFFAPVLVLARSLRWHTRFVPIKFPVVLLVSLLFLPVLHC